MESHGRVNGLYTLRSSHEGCRETKLFLYPSNKTLIEFSWTHFPVCQNKWPSKCTTLTRYAIQYETKCDFSESWHSKQNKHFLATTTALNTNETSKYTYELLLTSADRLLLSKSISLHSLLLALEHTFLFITTNGQASAWHPYNYSEHSNKHSEHPNNHPEHIVTPYQPSNQQQPPITPWQPLITT